MKLLVITPTLGTSAWLGETVASIAASLPAHRHVLVCPGANQAGLENRFPHSLVVADPHGGMYAAINAGVAASPDFDALTYLNDDDLLKPAGFAHALAMLQARPELDVVYGRVELVDSAGERVGALPVARRPADLSALVADRIMPLAQPGTLISRRLWDNLKGFDESYRLAGDLDFFVRALGAGARFAFVDAEVAAFRLRARQLSKQSGAMEAESDRARQGLRDPRPSWAARWRFRAGNLPVYFERIRRHGWISNRKMQDRVK